MKALILAAGHATRLRPRTDATPHKLPPRARALIGAGGPARRPRPLTDDIPKMLLPLAERPMLDYLLDRLYEVDELDAIHLVTNARFAEAFRDWAPEDVAIHDDGTTSNDDRLGAVGDIAFAI